MANVNHWIYPWNESMNELMIDLIEL